MFFFARVSQGLENNERVRYPIAESRKKSKKAFFFADSPTFFFRREKNQYFAENLAKPHTQHENTSTYLAVCKVPSQKNNKKYFSHKVKILRVPSREIITGEPHEGEGKGGGEGGGGG